MKREPIWILVGGGTALVQAVLQLLIEFHVPITASQSGAITALAGLLIAAYARTHVTPNKTVEEQVSAAASAAARVGN